jgi:hypothetical protein
LTASLDPPRCPHCNEIAIPAVSLPKGQTMIVKKTNQPTHRVYAVRKTGQNTGYWVEIGGAWANADIHQPGRTCENCGPAEGL